jgi:hypothetical protein
MPSHEELPARNVIEKRLSRDNVRRRKPSERCARLKKLRAFLARTVKIQIWQDSDGDHNLRCSDSKAAMTRERIYQWGA